MHFLSLLLIANLFLGWGNDLNKAKELAVKDHKYILLNFSGSDWCGPCIRMHNEIFETEVFKKFADDNLVLLNADFPRLKKNQLSKEQQKRNEQLADQYNTKGSFPLTILLTQEGKLVKQWDGLPSLTPEEFISQIKAVCNAVRQ